MAQVMSADLIASVEDWLKDNLPDSSISMIPSGADAPRSFTGGLPNKWVAIQWISLQEAQPTRADEDWQVFDLRLQCFARSNDRLAVADMADQFKELIANTTLDVKDRTNGTTVVGHARFVEVGIVPPQRDARDVLVSVVDVIGWVTTS